MLTRLLAVELPPDEFGCTRSLAQSEVAEVKGLLFVFREKVQRMGKSPFISFCPVPVFTLLGSAITCIFFARLHFDLYLNAFEKLRDSICQLTKTSEMPL